MKGFYGEPSEGKEGIVGGVAKALVKELTGKSGEVVETKIDTGIQSRMDKYEVIKQENGKYALRDIEDDIIITNVDNMDGFVTKEDANNYAKEYFGEYPETSTQHSIEITPELKAAVEKGQPLFKEAEAQYRIESGKNIIEAIKDFDGSPRATVALTHEIMHPTVVSIIDGAKEGNEVGAKHTKTIIDEYNKATGKNITQEQLIDGNDKFKEGTTTKEYRAVQEFIAKAWERYHREGGKGFSEGFQEVLDQITKAFKAVYKSLTGKELTPELRKMFDDILGKEAEPTPQTGKGEGEVITNAEEKQTLSGIKETEQPTAIPEQGQKEEKPPIFTEPKRTVFSHRGLQEVATEFGLDDITSRERISDVKLFKDVDEKISKWVSEGSYNSNINRLIENAKKGEVFSPEDNVIMAQHIAQLRERAAQVRKEFGINSKEYNDELRKVQDILKIGQKVRSDIGAALRVPTFARTYMPSLEDAMAAKMDALGVDTLLPEQKKQVEDAYNLIKEKEKEFDDYKKEAEKRFAEQQAKIELLEQQKTIKRKTGKVVKRDYSAERKSYVDDLKKAVEEYKQSGQKLGIASDGGVESFIITTKMAKIVMKIVGSHLEETGANLKEVAEKTLQDVKDIFTGIKESDIYDIISGKYSEKKETKNELAAKLREIRTESILLQEYKRLLEGSEPKSIKKATKRNQKLTELRNKVEALKQQAGEGKYSDIEKANKLIESNKKKAAEISKRIENKDFETKTKKESFWESEQFKKENPELYKKVLDSYREKEDAQHELDIQLLKDAESKKSKVQKTFDFLGAGANTTKKVVTGIDDSSLFMQTLASMLARPVIAGKAIKQHALDAFSKKRYERFLAELHNSPDWDLIQKSGLDVTEPKSLSQEKREEAFSGKTWDINFKVKGKEYKVLETLLSPFERAFTSLGNGMRVIAFRSLELKIKILKRSLKKNLFGNRNNLKKRIPNCIKKF